MTQKRIWVWVGQPFGGGRPSFVVYTEKPVGIETQEYALVESSETEGQK